MLFFRVVSFSNILLGSGADDVVAIDTNINESIEKEHFDEAGFAAMK